MVVAIPLAMSARLQKTQDFIITAAVPFFSVLPIVSSRMTLSGTRISLANAMQLSHVLSQVQLFFLEEFICQDR